MPRAFCVPAVAFLFCAFVLSFLTSISLPYLSALDISRTHFDTPVLQTTEQGLSELRFGIWAPCYYDLQGARTCFKAGHGYAISVARQDKTASVIIGSSWTRGLAIHPVATIVTFAAFLLSFSQHLTFMLLATLTSFLAALITLLAFAVDIALYAYTKHQFGKIPGIRSHTNTSPGFWLTFVSLILLLISGCTVFVGRHKQRDASASYPAFTNSKSSFWSRFRKN